MTIAFLNGEYMPLESAKISPMDRGFLFGDGIYEVIPCHGMQPVGLSEHLSRLESGLSAISLSNPLSDAQLTDVVHSLLSKNHALLGDSIGIYLHISRGADIRRFHAFPDNVEPTVFAFAFAITPPQPDSRTLAKGLKVALCEDKRWKRCNIKSTSLLGNVLHFQQAKRSGCDEVILYNEAGHVTEASTSNVFIVINQTIVTPPLDHQLLPGITRQLVLKSLAKREFRIEEREIDVAELLAADEVWLTSSSKEIAPVVEVGEHKIAGGKIGATWERAICAYHEDMFG